MIEVIFRVLTLTLALSVAVVLRPAPAAAAIEKRVALVIGNGAYQNTVQLPNAPKDSHAIAAKLTELGFLVIEGADLTEASMNAKLKEFSRALEGADVAMFFYAGHGMQISGENYIVPIDAALKNDRDVDFETMKVDLIIKQMLDAKVKLVFLDACRDNPMATALARSMSGAGRSRSLMPSTGLGKIEASSAQGTLIAFATAPGSVALDGSGDHSPFTTALLKHLDEPGVTVDGMMTHVRGDVMQATKEQQQPWTSTSLNSDFYLKPTQVASLSPANIAAPNTAEGQSNQRSATASGFDPRQIEFQLWQDAKSLRTEAGFRAYLAQFPNGTYAEMARQEIAGVAAGGIARTASAPANGAPTLVPLQDLRTALSSTSTEDALNLDEDGWKVVQQKLTNLGYGTRGIDGAAGQGTRQALRDWQTSQGLTTTGYLNGLQYEAIVGMAPVKHSASASGESHGTKTRRVSRNDDDEDRPSRTRSRGSRSNDSDAAASAVGSAIIGGIVGGMIGKFGH